MKTIRLNPESHNQQITMNNDNVPDEFEPGAPPVEPDEGPVPAFIPDDPEHDRVVDPSAPPVWQAEPTRQHMEVALCR